MIKGIVTDVSKLRIPCKIVKNVFDSIVQELITNLHDTLENSENGIGLASNQIGSDLRIIHINYKNAMHTIINPEIISQSGSQVNEEGCLSFPGQLKFVERARKITVKGLSKNGKPVIIGAKDMLAVVFQHEIDHINGIVCMEKPDVPHF